VVSILAQDHVMKASVAHAKSVFQPSAIVGKWKRNCFAPIVETRLKVSGRMLLRAMSLLWKAGRACSSAGIHASGNSIVVYTSARRSVTHRRRNHRIAQDRLISLRTALAGRRR
jgi:hypothetical protein